jgi:hypothetical protein
MIEFEIENCHMKGIKNLESNKLVMSNFLCYRYMFLLITAIHLFGCAREINCDEIVENGLTLVYTNDVYMDSTIYEFKPEIFRDTLFVTTIDKGWGYTRIAISVHEPETAIAHIMNDIIDTTIQLEVVKFHICNTKPGNYKGKFQIESENRKSRIIFSGSYFITKE